MKKAQNNRNNMNSSSCSTKDKVECNDKRFDYRINQGDMKEVNQGDIKEVNQGDIRDINSK
ncbi:MAG TPA: hypothetical protein GXZ70_08240 [Clostridiales bacterium]|jgi:hypothetical protein|nr:hypothetical protein [Clostridiales bacterium]